MGSYFVVNRYDRIYFCEGLQAVYPPGSVPESGIYYYTKGKCFECYILGEIAPVIDTINNMINGQGAEILKQAKKNNLAETERNLEKQDIYISFRDIKEQRTPHIFINMHEHIVIPVQDDMLCHGIINFFHMYIRKIGREPIIKTTSQIEEPIATPTPGAMKSILSRCIEGVVAFVLLLASLVAFAFLFEQAAKWTQ